MGSLHDESCLCPECVEDMHKWGHRRMRYPDVTMTFVNVSDEFFMILTGTTKEELATFRRNNT